MNEVRKVWHDDPIESVMQDTLGNRHVAETTAQLIADTHSWDSSVVFGVTGSWGSGKTSLTKMTCELLRQNRSEWSVAWFTPWATSDTESLVAEFYNTLASCTPESTGERIRKALSTCARTAGPVLRLVPLAGDRIADAATVLDDLLSQQPSWHVAFEEAAEQLKSLGRPVLVVADDIDRLQRDELLALLKVVRLLGRFPGVSYLLAYDEQTLHANLERADLGVEKEGRARVYMEKIVQYTIAVPPLLPNQMLLRLDAGLAALFERRGTPMPANDSRLARLSDVFESQLTTPRSVDRFLSQFELILSMHDVSEIDEIDLFLLTLVRVQFPDLYAQLRRWRRELTSNRTLWQTASRRDDEPDWRDLLSSVPYDADKRDAKAVLGMVFPVTSSGVTGGGTNRCRASDKDYFDRYFVHTVPEGDIPDRQISVALEQASTDNSDYGLMADLLMSTYPGKADLALSKFWDASTPTGRDASSVKVSISLLSAVMALLPHLQSGRQFFFGRQKRGISWAAHIIQRLSSDTKTHDLEAALNECSDLLLRLHVVWDARKISSERFVSDSARKLAGEALNEVRQHLTDGDAADPTKSVLFMLIFIAQHGDLADARESLHREMPRTFGVEDLAARCVGLASTVAAKPSVSINEFDQATFALFAPRTDDPFYHIHDVHVVDMNDVSWANRRLYVRGRAEPPEPA